MTSNAPSLITKLPENRANPICFPQAPIDCGNKQLCATLETREICQHLLVQKKMLHLISQPQKLSNESMRSLPPIIMEASIPSPRFPKTFFCKISASLGYFEGRLRDNYNPSQESGSVFGIYIYFAESKGYVVH
ncbi:hypothetical protein CEXT_209731 [Caerostris extrusa]|uniref:Uncharacterized protein n=1 Tax=Caerostris extrusa TaxID=172846 RepID=A0AAV4VTN2_CAEEX|nr:hypothetical protein CEXT_209731 [Caerostris extrusa]